MKRALLINFLGCLLCILLAVTNVAGQEINYLGIEQGLSNNAVTSVVKDHYGFVWIGTYDGLNRYDGSAVKIFRNVWGDSLSLNNNHVNKLAALDDKIFVGTQEGLVYYDYLNARFYSVNYQAHHSSVRQKISFNVTVLQSDAKHKVYVGTDYAGFYIYDQQQNISRQIPLGKANTHYTVQAINVDAQTNVWVFVRDVGLCRLNRQGTGQLQLVNNGIKSANCLLTDKKGSLWIGTDKGLFTYEPPSGSLIKYALSSGKFSSENIIDFKFFHSGELWLGTNGGGVNVVDTISRKVRFTLSGNETGSALHSNAISMIYLDNEARVWIATLRGGLNILDSRHNQFKLIEHQPFNKNSVINNFILSFCEDEQHNLWIGTDGGGLSYWDRKGNRYTSYVHNDDPKSLNSNFVVSIVKDQMHQVWIGMFSGGIDRFDPPSGRFIHYNCYNPVTKTNDNDLWKLYQDSHNNVWAGTTRGGALYKYNRVADRFEIFDERLTNIHAIFEDHAGNLWAGDYSRLIRIDPINKKHEYIKIKNAIRAISEDAGHHLWVGTEGGGLLKYDQATKQLTRFTQNDGLPSNSLLNLLPDNSGNLWGSTYNGLTMYNSRTGKFKNYYASDGLQSNQFNFNAGIKLQSGELAFGGINGFNIFYPDSISLPVHQPKLIFTGLHINNKTIEGNTVYTNNKAVADLQKITVPYNDATIGIDYTALEYSFPDKISYAYYLDGWDHGWNYVGKLKTAYYTRLNEGDYTLRIKITNTAGNWGGSQLLLRIVILPPWYRTWWAYLLYAAVIVTLVYWFWLYRIRQTKLKYEVQIANLKMEKEKEANEKKLSFFTNVSHEFRTPLTLIINPIKDLLRVSKDNHEDLNIVYRNARRLLGLVDHLLLFRKTESENAELKINKVNFADLCRDVYTCFTHQAKIKQINYLFDNSNDTIELYVDREKIEIALFNLISNAVKFTPDGGSIHIYIKEDEEHVYFEIADSGIGITADVGEKLFDKFYQVKDANSLKTGFGIGLYLVKTFIENHSGSINYKSTSGGTTFTLSLPKGKEHLSAYHITESAPEGYSYAAEELIDYDNSENIPADLVAANLQILISDRQSILIIDDNQEIRNYIKKIFTTDYVVLEAGNGELGLEMIKKHLPDVIISDIVMPGLSGLELCKIIKQDSALSHIPIILLTGESAPAIRLQGIEEGAVDFINKPFDKDLLVARVKGIIKNKTELQNYFFSEVTLKGKSRDVSEEHKDFLYKCIDIIENSLIDTELEVNAIADKMGMSYSSLYKKIRAVTGHSLNGFIRFVRLRKAAELMINTNCNVNEAAFRVGFNDIKYFREHFHKQFGLNPSEFIKRHRVAFQKSYTMQRRNPLSK